jgi:hypothetical protein
MLRVVLAALWIGTAGLAAGCSLLPAGPACQLTLGALPAGTDVSPGDPLPPGMPIIAAPDEVDATATHLQVDDPNAPELTIALKDGAVDRLAAHTAGHVGDSFVVGIDGIVVAVPFIMSSIADGMLVITPADDGAKAFANRLASCAT